MLLRRRSTTILVGLVALAAGWLAFAPAAGAHSALESSTPASGAVLVSSPTEITLTFNEPVALSDGAVRLLDVEGEELDLGPTTAVDAVVTTELPKELRRGSYVVAWKVMSADSHPVSGAFTFAVGEPSRAADGADPLDVVEAAEASSPGAQVAVDVTAALASAGALLAAGVALFAVFVADEPTSRVRPLVRWGAAVASLGLVAAIVAEAALVDRGLPSWSTFTDRLTGSVGLQALIGVSGLALLVAAVGGLGDRVVPAVRRLLVIDGSIGALVAFVIVGHTRTAAPVGLTMVADVVHLGAAAVWTGGLAALLLTVRGRDAGEVAPVVARFSSMATVAIVAVAAAGSLLAWRILGSWSDLVDTTYGVLLLVKVGLFLVVAAIGGYNKFRLVDRIAAEPEQARARLRTTLSAEIVVVLAIVAVTGSFTSISPEQEPTTPATTPLTCTEVQVMEDMPGMEGMDHNCTGTTTTAKPFDPTQGSPTTTPTSVPTGTPVRVSAPFGDGLALLTVAPARVGPNSLSIELTDADGASVDPTDLPRVELRLREKSIGPITATAERVGPGAYRVVQDLVLAGEWEINVSAVISDFEQPQAILKIDVEP